MKDILPGNESSDPCYLTVVGDTLFFAADDGVHGHELWKTDGTEAGTLMLTDCYEGTPSALAPGYSPYSRLTAAGGLLYMICETPASLWELWRSDGTAAGTLPVLIPGESLFSPYCFAGIGGNLFFITLEIPLGPKLWKSDGTASGTVEVTELNLGDLYAFDLLEPGYVANADTFIAFLGEDEEHGLEPWRSDGTALGTFMLKDIMPGDGDSGPFRMTACGDRIFFLAWDDVHGCELWVTDGTPEGTTLVKDIEAGAGSPWYGAYAKFTEPHFTPMGDTLFFQAQQDDTGFERLEKRRNRSRHVPDTRHLPRHLRLGPGESHPCERYPLLHRR